MAGKTTGRNARASVGAATALGIGLLACMVYGFGGGLRSDIGILLTPLAEQCGISYQSVSLCIAVMQVVFGGTQPFLGILASRKSNRFVLLLGVLFLASGLVGMACARSFSMLMLSLGVVFGIGTGALGFGLVLTSATYFVGPDRAMMIAGLLNAACGMFGFILSPAMRALLDAHGTAGTLYLLLVPVAVLAPIVLVITARDPKKAQGSDSDVISEETHGNEGTHGSRELFSAAFHNRTFLLLIAGFSTCGFHMVIIESHLYNQFVFLGIEQTASAWAFSVYGIATIIGALLSGWLSTHVRKGRLLGFYYGFRAVWVVAFLVLMPKNLAFAVVFSVGLGLTGDATVSPTSGLVHDNFSLAESATLIGVLFFCHQIGAFLSAWLGGLLFDVMGNYTGIWLLDIAVCVFASLMSLRIREGKARLADS
jgi:predicted MFS family arabinose efflux permease